MSEVIIGIVIIGAFFLVIFLAGFSANKLAVGVAGLLQKYGSGWAMTGRVSAFTVSFLTFLFAILVVFGMFFGR